MHGVFYRFALISMLSLLFLSACGGGGGSSSSSSDNNDDQNVDNSVTENEQSSPNRGPEIQAVSDFVLEQGASLSLTLLASDPDGDSLSFSSVGLPSFVSFTDHGNNSATLLFDGDQSEGSYPIRVVASDGVSDVIREFTVTVPRVNQAPLIESIAGISPTEFDGFEVQEGNSSVFRILVSDSDGDDLEVSLVDRATGMVPEFISYTANQQGETEISIVPLDGDSGSYTLEFMVSDGFDAVRAAIDIVVVESFSGLVSDIDVGAFHTCALEDGNVFCWGLNDVGQTNVPATLGNVTHIATGSYFSCAADEDGIHCWGRSLAGETAVPAIEGEVVKLAAGYNHACALTNVELACWGGDSVFLNFAKGQAIVPDDLGIVTDVAAGGLHTCVISNGTPRCWGSNNTGQSSVPDIVGDIDLLALGRLRSCIYGAYGLNCWGGEAGYDQNGPSEDLGIISQLDVGNFSVTCAIVNGAVICWGEGGEDIESWPHYGRKKVPETLGQATDIAVGDAHVCALDENGVHCWGAGETGEEGDYNFGQSVVPSFLYNQ